MNPYRTLLVDFERKQTLGRQLRDVLGQSQEPGFDVSFEAAAAPDAATCPKLANHQAESAPALALLAFERLPNLGVIDSVLRQFHDRNWHCATVVVAPAPSHILELFHHGVTDVWLPPLCAVEILSRATHWAEQAPLKESEAIQRRKTRLGLGQFIGESPAMLAEIRKIPLIAPHSVTVLIRGETGTGKEICARAIHDLSPRRARPFVAVNCGALPPELIENELFGHEAGAFSGANTRADGLVGQADGGTLFLDEVDSLPLSAQAKLLRFLQDKEYRRLGSAEAKTADVRVLAATNSDLQSLVQQGRFRQDLFFRLSVFELKLPPLRDRGGDIGRLAQHCLERFASEFAKPAAGFSAEARRKFRFYRWPGNVRELENVVARAVLLAEERIIPPGAIELPDVASDRSPLTFKQLKAEAIKTFERDYLTEQLREHEGNVSRAAAAAGKERRTFWELLRKHQLTAAPFRQGS